MGPICTAAVTARDARRAPRTSTDAMVAGANLPLDGNPRTDATR